MSAQGAGWKLRLARAELGLTEEALAGEMRRWAELRGEPRPDITADAVADWETGIRPLDLATASLLWLALEVPGEPVDLGGQPAASTWSLYRPSRPAANQGQRRRELLRQVAELALPVGLDPERLSGAVERTLRVDRRLAEGLTFIARRFPKEWGHRPPRLLRRQIHTHLRTILGLLDGLMPGTARRDLLSAAATTATLAGLVSIMVDEQEDAGAYLGLGERVAADAGDAEVRALALLFASHLVSPVKPDARDPDPPRASALVEAAARLVSPEAAPLARAWVLLRAAGERAWNGDELRAFRLMDEAEQLSTGAVVPSDGLVSPWTADTHVTFGGSIAGMLGRHDLAISLLESGLPRLGPDQLATRPRGLIDLAAAYALQGDVDHACELLSEAFELSRRAGLTELYGRIAGVRRRCLAGRESEPAVRRLDEQIRAR